MSNIETVRRVLSDGYYYEVRPGDVPGCTDIRYVEHDGTQSEHARVTVNPAELRDLIAILQARLPEAEEEERIP